MKNSKKLAEEHWQYIESVLLQQLQVSKKMYVDSFIHGYKHGQQDIKKNE